MGWFNHQPVDEAAPFTTFPSNVVWGPLPSMWLFEREMENYIHVCIYIYIYIHRFIVKYTNRHIKLCIYIYIFLRAYIYVYIYYIYHTFCISWMVQLPLVAEDQLPSTMYPGATPKSPQGFLIPFLINGCTSLKLTACPWKLMVGSDDPASFWEDWAYFQGLSLLVSGRVEENPLFVVDLGGNFHSDSLNFLNSKRVKELRVERIPPAPRDMLILVKKTDNHRFFRSQKTSHNGIFTHIDPIKIDFLTLVNMQSSHGSHAPITEIAEMSGALRLMLVRVEGQPIVPYGCRKEKWCWFKLLSFKNFHSLKDLVVSCQCTFLV